MNEPISNKVIATSMAETPMNVLPSPVRDKLIMGGFVSCIFVLGAVGVSCIFHAPQEWQLPKEVIAVVGLLAGNLLTGYFALQVGGRK
jgi:hypothetical protein